MKIIILNNQVTKELLNKSSGAKKIEINWKTLLLQRVYQAVLQTRRQEHHPDLFKYQIINK